ncbi:DUF4019 domain-containing protein [Massilia niabensis]|uniref:DUF4019 domain-containing protein n=1 Tax=Massilia niabensis TaxID=544910 RepID=A0ABW0L7N8_9BURK
MKAFAALVAAAAAFAVSAAHAQSSTPAAAPVAASAAASPKADANADTAAAVDAANRWLALMDAGQAVEAWDQAAPILQSAVTRTAWMDVGKSVRAPLGAVKSRRLASSVFTRTLPGAPEGEYVVVRYTTDFTSRAGITETVVPMRQPDGSWKVTTYRFR